MFREDSEYYTRITRRKNGKLQQLVKGGKWINIFDKEDFNKACEEKQEQLFQKIRSKANERTCWIYNLPVNIFNNTYSYDKSIINLLYMGNWSDKHNSKNNATLLIVAFFLYLLYYNYKLK